MKEVIQDFVNTPHNLHKYLYKLCRNFLECYKNDQQFKSKNVRLSHQKPAEHCSAGSPTANRLVLRLLGVSLQNLGCGRTAVTDPGGRGNGSRPRTSRNKPGYIRVYWGYIGIMEKKMEMISINTITITITIITIIMEQVNPKPALCQESHGHSQKKIVAALHLQNWYVAISKDAGSRRTSMPGIILLNMRLSQRAGSSRTIKIS